MSLPQKSLSRGMVTFCCHCSMIPSSDETVMVPVTLPVAVPVPIPVLVAVTVTVLVPVTIVADFLIVMLKVQ